MLRSLAFLGALFAAQDPPGELDPSDLVPLLSADDLEDREGAMRLLRTCGQRALPALEDAARSDDAEKRARARTLLRELVATSALIEDLASDDVPGNARSARSKLMRRYDARVRDALLEASRSRDTQQAVEAAFVVIERGDAAALLRAAPDIHTRAVSSWLRGETTGFAWPACQLMLRLDPLLDSATRDRSWKRSLAGVAPYMLTDLARDAWKMSRELGVAYPEPLLRHYLLNLRDDDVSMNAYWAGPFIRSLGDAAVPGLRELLSDHDPQARTEAAQLLLQMRPAEELPARVWVDLLPQHPEAAARLAALGESAEPALRQALDSDEAGVVLRAARLLLDRDRACHARDVAAAASSIAAHDSRSWVRVQAVELVADAAQAEFLEPLARDRRRDIALRAAVALARLDPERYAARLVPAAIANLATDGFQGNAPLAVEVLAASAPHAVAALRRALESDDEQVVAGAAIALDSRDLGESARAQLRRFLGRPDTDDAAALRAPRGAARPVTIMSSCDEPASSSPRSPAPPLSPA